MLLDGFALMLPTKMELLLALFPLYKIIIKRASSLMLMLRLMDNNSQENLFSSDIMIF